TEACPAASADHPVRWSQCWSPGKERNAPKSGTGDCPPCDRKGESHLFQRRQHAALVGERFDHPGQRVVFVDLVLEPDLALVADVAQRAEERWEVDRGAPDR